MKIIGIILVIIGIAMLVTGGFQFKQKKKVLDTDIVDISRTETKSVGWPRIVGGIVIAGGIALVVIGSRNKNG